jgi:hypothetical protein
LLRWVKPQAARLRGVFLVHGEPDRQRELLDGLRDIGVRNASNPARGESVSLDD